MERKLAAIFSADVQGYSRLMGDDEAATVRTLTTYREVMATLIQQHRGRVVDSPGDNVLAEFTSVVDAVQCAVAVQKELQARNADLPDNRRMAFRIGINLGDVIEEDARLYGDGVNIAARLEALADPGGICVSKTAFDHIETKLPLGYEYLGEQTVKNIAKPVGAYRVLMEPRVTVAGTGKEEKANSVKRYRAVLTGGIVVLLVGVGLLIWTFSVRPSVEPASLAKMSHPLPDKPSLAVLPFDNLSGDTGQDYLANGLTENIIDALSKIPEMFVIARHSMFTYKGKQMKIRQVAEDLGVQYVLEGSVQKSGERLRVTAQLIDALKGYHVWSEKYDRKLTELFAVQDNITLNIAIALQVKLTEGEQARERNSTDNLEAWSLATKALSLFETYQMEENAKARELFTQAVTLDPNYTFAWVFLGWTHFIDGYQYPSHFDRNEAFARATEIARKALSIDERSPDAYALLGFVYLTQRKFDDAVAAGKKALALDPNSSENHAIVAMTMQYIGDGEAMIALLKQAMRLDPYFPRWYLVRLGVGYRMVGRYEDSVAALKSVIEKSEKENRPHYRPYLRLATTYSMMGRVEEARDLVAKALEINPNMTLELWCNSQLYRDPAHTERIRDALSKAGMK